MLTSARVVFASLFVSGIAAGAALGATFQQPAPPDDVIPIVQASLTYDQWHVAHIASQNDYAAFYTFGYSQMLDFPVTTLVNLWSGSGELSKAIGPRGRFEDIDARRWDFPGVATEQHQALPEDLKSLLRAYVNGINAGRAWWRTHPGAIQALANNHTTTSSLFANPITGSPPLSAADLLHMFSADTGVAPGDEMAIRETHVLSLLLRFNRSLSTETTASNGWIVGSSVASAGPGTPASGPIVLSDPHLPVNDILWRGYYVDIQSPGYKATGWTIPGWPFVTIGFTPRIAWSVTAIPPRYPATLGTWYASYTKGSNKAILLDGVPQEISRNVIPYKYWNGTQIITKTNPNEPLGAIRVAFLNAEPGAPHNRPYPIVRDGYLNGESKPPCVPDHDILFQQSTAMTAGLDPAGNPINSGSLFEHFVRLAQATHAGGGLNGTDNVFSKGIYVLGPGSNFLVADVAGRMQYVRLSRVARQGPLADAPTPGPDGRFPWERPMDGSNSGFRWSGTHPYTDLPRRTSANSSTEVWICNNVSPDLVYGSNSLFSGIYPPAIWDGKTTDTWRQRRADTLLRSGAVNTHTNEVASLDQRDNWMGSLWPLFRAVAHARFSATSPEIAFINTMEAWMREDTRVGDPPGSVVPGLTLASNGLQPDLFDANRLSRTAPYLTLLRGSYEDAIGPRYSRTPCDTAPPENFQLGEDPLIFPSSEASFLADRKWIENVDAMAWAISNVVLKYFHDPASGQPNKKLQNASFTTWSFPGNPTPLPWAGFPNEGSDGHVRWGHANMLVLTRLFLPPPPAPGGTAFFDIYFNAAFGQWQPFLPPQRVEVFPVGGTTDSLFVTTNGKYSAYPMGATSAPVKSPVDVSPFFDYAVPPPTTDVTEVANTPNDGSTNAVPPKIKSGFKRYTDGVVRNGPLSTYFVPHSFGTRSVLSVTMPPAGSNSLPRGRFLAAVGGTEITAAIPGLVDNTGVLLIDGSEHYVTSGDFVNRKYQDLYVQANTIPGPKKVLTLLVPVQ